jgi:hypothetical protein
MSRSPSPYDYFGRREEAHETKPSVLQNLAASVTVLGTFYAFWQQSIGIAVFLFLTSLVTIVPVHGAMFKNAIRNWNQKRRRNQAAVRYRVELGEFVQRTVESVNTGRVDTVLYAIERIDRRLLQGIHPSSICELLRADLQLIERLRAQEAFAIITQRLISTVIILDNAFVQQTLQNVRTVTQEKPLAPHDRDQLDKALARWDRFLEDFESFVRKLNRDGSWEFNSYFERAGRT